MTEQHDEELRKASASCDAFLGDKKSELLYQPERTIATTQVKYDGATERGTSFTQEEAKNRIAACREMYDNVGIIGNIIDIMVDFAMEGITFVHPSRPIENFYRNWQYKVNLWPVTENIFKCLFRDANVPIIKFRGEINNDEIMRFRKTYAAKNKKGYFVDVGDRKTFVIPYAYKILDVLKIYKVGNELLGVPRYSYQISADDIALLQSPQTVKERESVEKLRKALSPDAFDLLISKGLLIIDPERVNMLYYKKDDFKQWANPLLWRVVDDVKFKKLLRDMDISAAESVCSAMTIIKLGNRKEGFHPNKAMFDKFGNMLKNPSKSKTILWDDLVTIETAYPPIERVLGSEKYQQVNDDIRSGLGVSEILVNGEGGNYSNSYLSVKTLLERLECARGIVLEQWLQPENIALAKAMGFREPAIIQMAHTSLQSEESERRLILELYDRNIVSARTVAMYFDENLDVEIKRMREEAKIRKEIRKFEPDMTLFKVGKFTPVNFLDFVGLDEGESPSKMDSPEESPTEQGDEGDKGGRPPGTKRKQQTPKKVSPKGRSKASMDIIIDEKLYKTASKRFSVLYKAFATALARKHGYDSEKDFSDVDYENIFDAIDKVLCGIDSNKDYTKENIIKILSMDLATAPAKLERCVKDVKQKRIKDFIKKNGRRPNKKEMQDITSSAYAICRKSLNV